MNESVNLEPFNWCPVEDETWYHVSSFWIQDGVGENVEVSDVLVHMNQNTSQRQWTLFGELVPRISNLKTMEIRATIISYVVDFGGKSAINASNKGFWFKDINDVWFKCELPVNGKDEIYMLQTLEALTAYNHVRINRFSSSPFIRVLANVTVTNHADVMASLLLSSESKMSYAVRGNLVPRDDCMEFPRLQVKIAVEKYLLHLDKPKEISENGIFWVCDVYGMWYKLVSYSAEYKLHADTALKNTFKSLNCYNFPADYPGQLWRHLGSSSVRDKFGNLQSFEMSDNETVDLSMRGQLIPPENSIQPRVTIDVPLKTYSIDFGLHPDDPNRGLWVQDINHVWYKLEYPYDPEYREIANQAVMNCNQFLAVYDAINAKGVSTFVGRTGKLQCKHSIATLHDLSNGSFDLNFVAAKKDFVLKHLSSSVDFDKSVPFVKSVQSLHVPRGAGSSSSRGRAEHKSNVGRGGDSSDAVESSEGDAPTTENETKVGKANSVGASYSATATKGLLAQLELTMQPDDTEYAPVKAFQARADGRDSFPSMEEHYEPPAALEAAAVAAAGKRNAPKKKTIKATVIETSSSSSQQQLLQQSPPSAAAASRLSIPSQGPTTKPIPKKPSVRDAEVVDDNSGAASFERGQSRQLSPQRGPPAVGGDFRHKSSVSFGSRDSSSAVHSAAGWLGGGQRSQSTTLSPSLQQVEAEPLWRRPSSASQSTVTAAAQQPVKPLSATGAPDAPQAASEFPGPVYRSWFQPKDPSVADTPPAAPIAQEVQHCDESVFRKSDNWVQRSYQQQQQQQPPPLSDHHRLPLKSAAATAPSPPPPPSNASHFPYSQSRLSPAQFRPPPSVPASQLAAAPPPPQPFFPAPIPAAPASAIPATAADALPLFPPSMFPSRHYRPSRDKEKEEDQRKPPAVSTSSSTVLKSLSSLSGRYSTSAETKQPVESTTKEPPASLAAKAKDREDREERGRESHTRESRSSPRRDRDRSRDRDRQRDASDYRPSHRRSPSPASSRRGPGTSRSPPHREARRNEFGRDNRGPSGERRGDSKLRDFRGDQGRHRSPSLSESRQSLRDDYYRHRERSCDRDRDRDRDSDRLRERGSGRRDRRSSPPLPPPAPSPVPPAATSSTALTPTFETRTKWPYNQPAREVQHSPSSSLSPPRRQPSSSSAKPHGNDKGSIRMPDYSVPKSKTQCTFFGGPGGCRNGDKCPFAHSNNKRQHSDIYGPGSLSTSPARSVEGKKQQQQQHQQQPGFLGTAAAYSNARDNKQAADAFLSQLQPSGGESGASSGARSSGYEAGGSAALGTSSGSSGCGGGATVPSFLRPTLDWEPSPPRTRAAGPVTSVSRSVSPPPPFKKLRSSVSPDRPATPTAAVAAASRARSERSPSILRDLPPQSRSETFEKAVRSGLYIESGDGGNDSSSSSDSLRINLGRIARSLDDRTTVMVHGIHHSYNQQQLELELDNVFQNSFDQLVFPYIDKLSTSRGYCFVNFKKPSTIPHFIHRLHGGCIWKHHEGMWVSYAKNQKGELHKAKHQLTQTPQIPSRFFGPDENPAVEQTESGGVLNSLANEESCASLMADVSESLQNALKASEVFNNEGAASPAPAVPVSAAIVSPAAVNAASSSDTPEQASTTEVRESNTDEKPSSVRQIIDESPPAAVVNRVSSDSDSSSDSLKELLVLSQQPLKPLDLGGGGGADGDKQLRGVGEDEGLPGSLVPVEDSGSNEEARTMSR